MSSNALLKAIIAGLFALLLTPVIVSKQFYFPFVGLKSLYFMAVVEVVFFLWLVLIWKWKQYRPNLKNPVIIAILAFLAVSFLSAIFGVNFSVSFWSKFERMGGVLMFGHLAALAIVASSVLKGRDWNRLFGASVIVALFVAIEALFDQSAAAGGGGYLGNDSFWGAYILFNIFFAFYLFFSKEWSNSKNLRIFAAASFCMLVMCLFIEGAAFWVNLGIFHLNQAGSYLIPSHGFFRDMISGGARAVKISLILGLSLIGVLWLATQKNLKAKIAGRTALAALFFGGLLVIILSTLPGNPVYQAMKDRFGEGTIHGRTVIWDIAWKGFLERPLLGWGPDNFDLAFTKYYNPCLGTDKCAGAIWYDRAHSIIFDTLVMTGLLGLISYLAVLASVLWVLWKKYRERVIDFAPVGVFTAALVAYFLQDLTVFDTVDSYLMFFLILGFVASLPTSDSGPVKAIKEKATNQVGKERRLRWYEWAGLGIIFLVFINNFVIGPLKADYSAVATVKTKSVETSDGRIVKKDDKPFGSDARLAFYQETLADSPMGKFQVSDFFAQVFLDALQDRNRTIPADQQAKEFGFLTDLIGKNIQDNPLDYKSRIILGELYTFWGLTDNSKFALAESTLRDAMKISPDDQEGYWNLAQTMMFQMRFDDALLLAQQALALEPDHPKSNTIIYQIQQIKQKMDKQPLGSVPK